MIETDNNEAERKAVDRVLRSRTFQKSPLSQALLTYLYEHNGKPISEYGIGTEALGRRADFDPRVDSAVRVQMSRLRTRLAELYKVEARESSLRVDIPKGSYEVKFLHGASSTPDDSIDQLHASSAEDSQASTKGLSSGIAVLIASLLVALAVTLTMLWRDSVRSANVHDRVLSPLWTGFIGGSRPVRIVLSNPAFFGWEDPKEGGSIRVRVTRINDFSEMGQSKLLEYINEKYGRPVLSQDYIGTNDTISALDLTRYLEARGIAIQVSTTSSSPLSLVEKDNLILIGNAAGLVSYSTYLNQLSLSLPIGKEQLIDRFPLSGEPSHYDQIHESASRTKVPQIFAVIHGNTPNSQIMVIEGFYTNALISYITSQRGLDEIENMRALHGNARFFEAVIVSEMSNDVALQTSIAAFKPLDSSGSKSDQPVGK
jgi:hypothetical protein